MFVNFGLLIKRHNVECVAYVTPLLKILATGLARMLSAPTRCVVDNNRLNFAAMKYIGISLGPLRSGPCWYLSSKFGPHVASLSQRHSTDLFSYCAPQIAAAKMIGSSSFAVILYALVASDHWYWNHAVFSYAPHPRDPEASEVRITSGLLRLVDCIMERPFH